MAGRRKTHKNYYLFNKPRTRTVRAINNIYVLNVVSINALLDIKDEYEGGKRKSIGFIVPGVKGDGIVAKRKRESILQLLDSAIYRDLYKQSIIHGVAIIEDYLSVSLRTVLRWFPEKIAKLQKSINITSVISYSNVNDLLLYIIDKQINELLYASPKEYFKSLEEILAIHINDDVKDRYSEIKATRDLLVHNNGEVNETYARKSGAEARAIIGQNIPVDESYFDSCISTFKDLVKEIYEGLMAKYGNKKIDKKLKDEIHKMPGVSG